MKLHHTEYKKNYRQFILDSIVEDYNNKPFETDQEKINFLRHRFTSEYGFMIDQFGQNRAMVEWLQGLALDIPFYNAEIVEFAVSMGSIEENPSETLQSRVVENYWKFMANIILTQLLKEVK